MTIPTVFSHRSRGTGSLRVLRAVAVGSASGAYGGPFDTAQRQVGIVRASGVRARMLYGVLPHDGVEVPLAVRVRVRRLVGSRTFSFVVPTGGFLRVLASVVHADVVHLSLAREPLPILVLLLARSLRVPVVAQPHGMLTSRTTPLHRALDVALRALIGSSTGFIALTDHEAESIRVWHRGAPTIQVLGNPLPPEINISSPRIRAKHAHEAIFIARLHPRKCVLDFAAASALTSAAAGVQFVVVGPDGGDRAALVGLAEARPNLEYEGALPASEVSARLARADVFVLTSRGEPWGNVLVSALALGIPVVVTESADLAASIQEFGAGAVVPDASPEAVARAVERLMTDDVAYAAASAGGLGLARNLVDPDVLANRLSAIYMAARR